MKGRGRMPLKDDPEGDLWIVLHSGLSVWNRDGVLRGVLPRGSIVRVLRGAPGARGRRLGWEIGPGGLVGWVSGEGLAPWTPLEPGGEEK